MERKIKIGLICLLVAVILFGISFIAFQKGEAGSICFTDSQCSAPTGYNPVCDKGRCGWSGGGNFEIPHSKWCEVNLDCHWVCGCGCINKNAKCETPEDIMYDCYPGMDKDYSCVCKDNQCETIKNR